jgi:hypothetical protein
MSEYPKVANPDLVGEYPASAGAGGGYFFDEVLEYRVWCHPERGAPDEFEGNDYYHVFANFEDARAFSGSNPGTEEPLALIRQLEWVDEPEPGRYVHMKGERIAEWHTKFLSRGPRKPGAVEQFIAERAGA